MVNDDIYPDIKKLIQNIRNNSKLKATYHKSTESKNYSKILDSIEKNIVQSN